MSNSFQNLSSLNQLFKDIYNDDYMDMILFGLKKFEISDINNVEIQFNINRLKINTGGFYLDKNLDTVRLK